MTNSYLVYYNTGKIIGILSNKTDKKIFESQRDMDSYEIIKVNQEELLKLTGHLDIGRYLSIEIEGFILFPREEIALLECLEMELSYASSDIPEIYGFISPYVKFTDEEKELMEFVFIDFVRMVRLEETIGVSLSSNVNTNINRRALLEGWVSLLDEQILEDDDF